MLDIVKIPTKKHKIKQRALMKHHVIPHFPSISIFSGAAGSGKTNLVANLLSNQNMYGPSHEDYSKQHMTKNPIKKPYFDAIFLFIGSMDDMYDQLIEDGIIKQNHVCEQPTPDDVQKVIDTQNSLLEQAKGDITKIPKILLIFDDVVNDGKFMRSKAFLTAMVKGRHFNSSTFLCTQYINLVSRPTRIQANYMFIYKMNRQEVQVITDQFCPPNCTKNEFAKLLDDATSNDEKSKHNFLVIEKGAAPDVQFRKNLDKFITVKRLNYVPKLEKIPPKELQDREFDNEFTIREINDDFNFKELEKKQNITNINNYHLPEPEKPKTGRPKMHIPLKF